MTKVSGQILIDAPVQKVWEVLADFGGVQNWAPGVTKSYSTSPNNSGSGAARHCDVPGFGGIEEYITEWNDGSGFTFQVEPVGLIDKSVSKWSVTPQGDKTLVYTELDLKMRFGPIGALMEMLFVRRRIENGIRNGLAGLERHVKTGELIGTEFRAPKAA